MKTDNTLESTLTDNGQTIIPMAVRDALNLKPGDKLNYKVEGDHLVVRVHYAGAASLAGALGSDKGKEMSFAEIREAATKNAAESGYFDKYR